MHIYVQSAICSTILYAIYQLKMYNIENSEAFHSEVCLSGHKHGELNHKCPKGRDAPPYITSIGKIPGQYEEQLRNYSNSSNNISQELLTEVLTVKNNLVGIIRDSQESINSRKI